MKPTHIFLLSAVLFGMITFAAPTKNVARVVDLKTPDGTILKGTYFAAAKPGPGALLFHQSNRTRKSWDDVARQLAAAGINTLTVDVPRFASSIALIDRKSTRLNSSHTVISY